MSISPEELAAFADGELSSEDEARVAAAVDADPELARQVAAHRALRSRLAGHFAPILEQDVPERLTRLLENVGMTDMDEAAESKVVDFASAREMREAKRRLPGWSNWAGTAIAASLVAALVFTLQQGEQPGYAGGQLAAALDSQLVATQPGDADTRILLSFVNDANEFCRAFSAEDGSGIACRDTQGWRYQAVGSGSSATGTEFRMAGSDTDLMAIAQEMAAGAALSTEEEAAARSRDWQN